MEKINTPNPKVDKYLVDGCMRCKYGATPQCKVNRWKEELVMLRHIALECGLTEELKWSMPCYMHNNRNILMIAAFKNYVSMSFFKGTLLTDSHQLLVSHGENSQANRFIRFTSPEEVLQLEQYIKTYIAEAIELEKSGVKTPVRTETEPIPEEFEQAMEEDAELRKAFYALTPGRRRAYILYFSGAKQMSTRLSRIAKCREMILNGIGLNDR